MKLASREFFELNNKSAMAAFMPKKEECTYKCEYAWKAFLGLLNYVVTIFAAGYFLFSYIMGVFVFVNAGIPAKPEAGDYTFAWFTLLFLPLMLFFASTAALFMQGFFIGVFNLVTKSGNLRDKMLETYCEKL